MLIEIRFQSGTKGLKLGPTCSTSAGLLASWSTLGDRSKWHQAPVAECMLAAKLPAAECAEACAHNVWRGS